MPLDVTDPGVLVGADNIQIILNDKIQYGVMFTLVMFDPIINSFERSIVHILIYEI